MKRILSLTLGLMLMVLAVSSVLARPNLGDRVNERLIPNELDRADAGPAFTDRADTLFLFASSGPGAFGMPGTDARGYTFDHPGGQPAGAGWTGYDKTAQQDEYWHLEDAHLVDGHATDMSQAGQPWTPGDPINDFAMWCGRPDVCGWVDPNGYGNNWDQRLRIQSADFGDSLLFEMAYAGFFEGDVWDFFQAFVEVTEGDETTLEEFYRNTASGEGGYHDLSITVPESDYPDADSFGDVVLRFSTDGAWSDEDGLFITDYGAVWGDNFVTRVDGADVLREDLEDGELPEGITPETPPGAGDFAELYSNLYEEDQCGVNNTFAWAFFDIETTNDEYPSGVIVYGPPYIDNDIWSPVLDSAHEAGNPVGQPVVVDANTQVNMHFWVYADLPQDPLIYYSWSVAAKTEELECVSVWKNDNTVYYGDDKQWFAHNGDDGFNVTQYVAESAQGGTVEGLRMALNCVDMCPFWCDTQGDGEDHTPGPYFDNARLMLINASSVGWDISGFHRFQDNFPEEADDGMGGAAGKVRIDSAYDAGPIAGPVWIGDSTMIELNMDLSGGVKEEFNNEAGEMRPAVYLWYQVVSGPHAGVISSAQADQGVSDGIWSPWAGSATFDGSTYGKLQADDAVTQGVPQPGKYAFDFADNYFLPGDIIHFFYRAEANNGTIETRPQWAMAAQAHLRGRYIVRCLPGPGTKILLCDDHLGVATWWEEGFAYNGYSFQDASGEGGGYDIYSTQAPGSGLENGLAGRATIEDLTQYNVICWDSGSLPAYTVTTSADDLTQDDVLLTDFMVNSDRDTYLWMMGDVVANDVGGGDGFITQVLGANLLSDNQYYDDWNGIIVPKVYGIHSQLEYLGVAPWFWVDGGCPSIENFSLVEANTSVLLSVPSHFWEESEQTEVAGIFNTDPDGNGLPTSPGGHMNHVLYNPFSYYQVWDGGFALDAGVDYARYFVGQVLTNLFGCLPDVAPDDVGETPAYTQLNGNFPNPFNPKTTITFALASDEFVNISVYDITGRRVTELVNGPMEAGHHEIVWSGKNASGIKVASGVYFYKMNAGAYSSTEKMVILK